MASFNTAREPTVTEISTVSEQSTRRDRDVQDEIGKHLYDHGDYTVGWVCALPLEMAAAEAMLDAIHEPLPNQPHDGNAYTLGSVGSHKVVLACLPKSYVGTNNAVAIATNMQRSFPSIGKRLLVGIGGGAPDQEDVRLGDIVVGDQVIQYDFGKAEVNGGFQRTSVPTRPPQVLMTAVAKLQATFSRLPNRILATVDDMLTRYPGMSNFRRPDTTDRLYRYDYDHVPLSAKTCQSCDPSQLVERQERTTKDPVIHYGKIASGNKVIKDGKRRRDMAKELNVICFEMEAAGLVDNFKCLVIRGICDYADSHKNKDWQGYSAVVAASYARELLLTMAPSVPGETPAVVVSQSSEEADTREKLERRKRLFKSLFFPDSENRQSTIKTALKNTCEWFLSSSSYTDWLDQGKLREHHGFLWISGKPGAGKSTMMKFLFSHTQQQWHSEPNTAIVSFFFNARGVDLEKSTTGLYRSLLFQILTAFPDLQVLLDDPRLRSLQVEDSGQHLWSFASLQRLFQKAVESLKNRTLVCFIDALDECDEEEVRSMVEMFDELGETAFSNSTRLYICLSSRHYPHIEIQPCLRSTLESLAGHVQDMEKYVRHKLKGGKSSVVPELSDLILQKAAGVFMWVILAVDILNRELQRGKVATIKQYLQKLPSRLSDLFRDMICRSDTDNKDLLLCIQWLLYAERPLTISEFYCAMHSTKQPLPDDLLPWDLGRMTREQMQLFVIDTSKGLAEVTEVQKHRWEDSLAVQFIHESVRDFLLKDGGLEQLQLGSSENAEAWSHDRLKECCHFYINAAIPFISSMEQDIIHLESQFPFLAYAVTNVFHHADKACSAISQHHFLEDVDPMSWTLLANMTEHSPKTQIYRFPKAKAALMVCIFARFGWAHLLNWSLCQKPLASLSDLFSSDSNPLLIAAVENHIPAIKILLSHRVLDNEGFRAYGDALLQKVVEYGDDAVARALLEEKDFDLDFFGSDKRRLLALAASNRWYDDRAMVKLVLTARERRDTSRPELLLWAASHGSEVVVEELLSLGVDFCDLQDAEGRTAFWWACSLREMAMAKQIAQSAPIDVHASDCNGDTALLKAVGNADSELVEFLLELQGGHGLNTRDNKGRTPLMRAIQRCPPDAITEMLLGSKDVDINLQDNQGLTALSWAAKDGFCGSMMLLLKTEGIRPNQWDEEGKTPLFWATTSSISSYQKVRLLLFTDAVDVDAKDFSGTTPLIQATKQGKLDVVELLVVNGNCNIHLTDKEGMTAADWAVKTGHLFIAKYLRELENGTGQREGDDPKRAKFESSS